jgi:phosphotransacetylase
MKTQDLTTVITHYHEVLRNFMKQALQRELPNQQHGNLLVFPNVHTASFLCKLTCSLNVRGKQ